MVNGRQKTSETQSFNCFDQRMVLVLVVSISALPSFKSDCSCSSWTSWSSWPTQCHKWPWTEKITVFRVMMLLLRRFASLDSCIEFKTSKNQNMYQVYSNLLQSTLWQKCNKLRAYLSYIVQASSLSSKVPMAWPWASLQLPVGSWDIGQPWIRGTWDMKVPACHCRLRLQPLIAELQAMVSFAQRAAQWHLSHKIWRLSFLTTLYSFETLNSLEAKEKTLLPGFGPQTNQLHIKQL